jgi:four helix bundle protein
LALTVLVRRAMSIQTEQLKARARRFALDVLELIKLLPATEPGPTIRRQLAKSATSVDMNYRAACRGRSHTEFTAKIGTVAEEADESAEWLDVIAEAKLVRSPELQRLQTESRELLAIFSATVGTARRNERARSIKSSPG